MEFIGLESPDDLNPQKISAYWSYHETDPMVVSSSNALAIAYGTSKADRHKLVRV